MSEKDDKCRHLGPICPGDVAGIWCELRKGHVGHHAGHEDQASDRWYPSTAHYMRKWDDERRVRA